MKIIKRQRDFYDETKLVMFITIDVIIITITSSSSSKKIGR